MNHPNFPYKYGLKPVQPESMPLMLRKYLRPSLLPDPASLPAKFGHDNLVGGADDWGMFLNDRIGCCAIAAAIHIEMLFAAETGRTVNWNQTLTAQNSAAVNYAAVTGYEAGPEIENPDAPQNPTDQGTDIGDLMRYWQQTGIVDADGNAHKILGWAGLTRGNWEEFLIALHLFQAVLVGIQVPDYAEQQFADGQPWHVERGLHQIVGGHAIPAVARNAVGKVDAANVISWDKDFPMEQGFYERENIAAVVVFTEDMLSNMKTIDGVDDATLRADLPLLNTGEVP